MSASESNPAGQQVSSTSADVERTLRLVREAMDEFERVPLDASLRRGVRIASAMGDTREAIRLALETRSPGGDRTTNGAELQALLDDPSQWDTKIGPHEEALRVFTSDRRMTDGDPDSLIVTHSVSELERLVSRMAGGVELDPEIEERYYHSLTLLDRTRGRLWLSLCAWEKRLRFIAAERDIITSYRSSVDEFLSGASPDLLDQFNLISIRLDEAARQDSPTLASESLSHALTTCRRILKAVTDTVAPIESAFLSSGDVEGEMTDAKYRNRLRAYVRHVTSSESIRDSVATTVDALIARFVAIDHLSSKGVHAKVAHDEAQLCAVNTYVLAGEVLSLRTA